MSERPCAMLSDSARLRSDTALVLIGRTTVKGTAFHYFSHEIISYRLTKRLTCTVVEQATSCLVVGVLELQAVH